MEWVLKQVVKLEDNRELVQGHDMEHENSREQSDLLVKNMETINTE